MKTKKIVTRRAINKIAVERDEHGIHGVIELFAPIPQLGNSGVVAMEGAPGGKVGYRHNFTIPQPSRKRPG
jgi:hypothetical protein